MSKTTVLEMRMFSYKGEGARYQERLDGQLQLCFSKARDTQGTPSFGRLTGHGVTGPRRLPFCSQTATIHERAWSR
ncbi:hypothetical protein [Comamonas terrigena]|uniref:Uncharacterized protein n=1 Tax=Comamonas terrigena TaxID=32013 RepID=A0A2A7UPP0_COMTR|nr:hypothetical protein [Comamonas terrigena]PEH87214.1 hypothetical protein CRM82_00010 [Comamonas terrigena]